MKLLIVRHGDPDYSIDSLTTKGVKEAELLGARMDRTVLDDVYVSPFGRAKLTAEIALKNKHIKTTTCDWLREFSCSAQNPEKTGVIWDLRPSYYTAHKAEYDGENWQNAEIFANSNISEAYRKVADGIDEILLRHGYKRNGLLYEAIEPNYDTIALFCHFGVERITVSVPSKLHCVADFCDNANDGRKRKGYNVVQVLVVCGYRSFVCRRRRTVFCGQICGNTRQRR